MHFVAHLTYIGHFNEQYDVYTYNSSQASDEMKLVMQSAGNTSFVKLCHSLDSGLISET